MAITWSLRLEIGNIDGVSGHDEILEKFRQVYSDLYNSAGTEEAMSVIKETLHNMIGADSIKEVEKVTGDVVKKACCRMKPSKMDVSGSYTSDVFLHAPDIMFEIIAHVFRSFLIHGDVTRSLLVSAFLPLFKGGIKDP